MFRDTTLTTADAPFGREVDYWRSSICDVIFELDIAVDRNAAFRASLRQQSLGSIGLSRIEMNLDQTVNRTRQAIARSRQPQFEFVTIQTGCVRLAHRGRDATLKAGDSILVDNREPFTLRTQAHSKTTSFHFPASWLKLWLPHPEKVIAQPIAGESPWGRVLAALTAAPPPPNSGCQFAAGLYADQLAGAIVLALQCDRDDQRASPRKTFERCMELLRASAHDCELDAHRAARELGISLRYLHKVFAAQGTSYGAALLQCRLDLAARMLRQPQFVSLSVAEIAWRAGFADPSNFYRRFRERYGAPPGVYRTGAGEDGAHLLQ